MAIRRLAPWILLSATLLFAQSPAVPVTREPSHHLVLDNEYVRVFGVTVAPHAATVLHQHDLDYVFVTLGDAHISNEKAGAAPVDLKLPDGDVRYSPGGFAHVARNLADTPFHNITIELKNPGKPLCGTPGTDPCGEQEHNVLFETEHVHAILTDLAPGARTSLHTHIPPHLAVALDDLIFENHVEGKPTRTFSMKKGEWVWVAEPVTHWFENAGSARGRILALEFK